MILVVYFKIARGESAAVRRQLSIFSSDAFRLSSREFLARYHNMQKNMSHIEKVSNRPLEQLRDLLEIE